MSKRNSKSKGRKPYNPKYDNSSENQTVSGNAPQSFGGNSIEWYNRYPSLLLGAGQIPYPYKPGMFVPVGGFSVGGTDFNNAATTIPGLLRINWSPSLGKSDSQTSPASVVGKEIYAKVRSVFSGSLDADAPDFMIYLMALDSIFSYIAYLKRIYRCINAYSPENYFIPDGVLEAMGISTAGMRADVRADKMNLYQSINELVYMTKKFKCPRIMDVFNRHVWLNDHLYFDADSPKGQLYMFNQVNWYIYKEQNVPGVTPTVKAGGLEYVNLSLPETGIVAYLFQFGRNLIDALAASDDGYLISGYLMRAYEGTPDFTVDELLLDEIIVPKYNQEVLGEIENSHAIPTGGTISNVVAQNPTTNAIISNPTVSYPSNNVAMTAKFYNVRPRLTSRMDNPTIADTVINSRMMSYITNPSGTDTITCDIVACTEIVQSYTIFTATGTEYENYDVFSEYIINSSTTSKLLWASLAIAQWDWSPAFLVIVQYGAGAGNNTCFTGDVHNITSFDMETYRNLSRVCLYSLFNAFTE